MCKQHRIITRRDFIKYAGCTAAGAALLSALRPTVSFAQTSGGSGPIDIYIRVYFSGGADGLSWVVPRNPTLHAALKAARPSLMGPQLSTERPGFGGLSERPEQTLDLGYTWGLNPIWSAARVPAMGQNQLPGMYELIQQGKAKVLSKVGFPGIPSVTGSSSGVEHDLNHITATDPWNIGKPLPDRSNDLFWEVRLMQQAQLQWNQFWVLGDGGRNVPPRPYPNGPTPTVARFLKHVKRYQVSDWDGYRNGQLTFGGAAEVEAAQAAIRAIMSLPDEPTAAVPKREYKRSMLAALDTADYIQNNVVGINLPSYFPDESSQYPYGIYDNFKDIARIISHYYINQTNRRKLLLFVALPNFDTHGNQVSNLLPYSQGVNHCLGALYRFLNDNQLVPKTVIQFVSEFGRGVSTRFVDDDGSVKFSDGTPHGWGSMHFIVGNMMDLGSSPFVGQLPTLSDISSPIIVGSADRPASTLLRASLDPREVYYRVVQAMGFNAASIFSGFSPTSTLPSS